MPEVDCTALFICHLPAALSVELACSQRPSHSALHHDPVPGPTSLRRSRVSLLPFSSSPFSPVLRRRTRPNFSLLSPLQTDSMVEIMTNPLSASNKLLYSKSHVYVHPTAYSRDNVCGFAALVEQKVSSQFPLSQLVSFSAEGCVCGRSQDPNKVLLCWIPESIARARPDYESFLRADGTKGKEPEDAGMNPLLPS